MNENTPADDSGNAVLRLGWAVFRRRLETDFLIRLRADLAVLYGRRRAVQCANGVAEGMDGTCHHLLGDGTAMDELVARLPLDGFIREFFGGPYILNSFGGVVNSPDGESGYIGRIHRDVRTYAPDFRLMLNMLVMLDSFTADNGATHLLPGSHLAAGKPSRQSFLDGAVQVLGDAGDIAVFDSRLWHAAGVNRASAPRRALTLTYTRPFFKQQFDYPRYLGGAYGRTLTPAVRQVLGYEAGVPATIDAFYQPPDRRAYRPGQG